MSATFELWGRSSWRSTAGRPSPSSQGISLFVDCDTQEEVDELWKRLSEGGEPSPAAGSRTGSASRGRSSLAHWASSWATRTARSRSVMQAMLQMSKIEIEESRRAAESS